MKILSVACMLLALVACACCASQTQEPVKTMTGLQNMSKTEQRMSKFLPGVAWSKEGPATSSPMEVGFELQNGVTAAPNAVQISPLVGSQKAAAELLQTQTPQEAAIVAQLQRTQDRLVVVDSELAVLAPEDARRTALVSRRDALETSEATLTEKLGTIYEAKLKTAAGMVPDLSALTNVYYNIFAPQNNTTGKAFTDAQAAVLAEAYGNVVGAMYELEAAEEEASE